MMKKGKKNLTLCCNSWLQLVLGSIDQLDKKC